MSSATRLISIGKGFFSVAASESLVCEYDSGLKALAEGQTGQILAWNNCLSYMNCYYSPRAGSMFLICVGVSEARPSEAAMKD